VSSPPVITIKLEIQIPTGGGAPSVQFANTGSPEPVPQRAPQIGRITIEDDIRFQCPDNNGQVPVRLSGSGGTGTICGWVQFVTGGVTVVRALVVQDPLLLGSTPPATAVGGVQSTSDPRLWTWNGNLGQTEIPGAVVGSNNTLALWWLGSGSGSASWTRHTVTFTGVTGTTDPCGGGNSACFSGSTPLVPPGVAPSRPAPRTYPAVWLVATGGFVVAPLALFNATWALREVHSAARPTWDNAADGHAAPRVQLKLCPKDGWILGLHFREVEVRYTLPFTNDPFGPLVFAERVETVHGLGTVLLPRVLVSAV
jgi:hypothetical protein